MRRWALLLVTTALAGSSAAACELLVSTKGFSEPDDAPEAGADVTFEAPAPPPPPRDAGPDARRPASCACYLGAGAAYCLTVAAAHSAEAGCVIDAGDAGLGDLLGCADGVWSLRTTCNSGCTATPSGRDECICPCVAGPGDYCGSTVLDAEVRYDCYVANTASHAQDLFTCAGNKDGGVWSFKTPCPNGCMFVPTGSDVCK
jgi:hypothetical protein